MPSSVCSPTGKVCVPQSEEGGGVEMGRYQFGLDFKDLFFFSCWVIISSSLCLVSLADSKKDTFYSSPLFIQEVGQSVFSHFKMSKIKCAGLR